MSNVLYDALFAARQGSSRPFLYLPGGRILTYDRFLRLSARIAHVIRDHGALPGERVVAQVREWRAASSSSV